MNYIKQLFLIMLAPYIFHYACAAEQMSVIETLDDLKPFMGKFVIFHSDKYYFSGVTHAYTLPNIPHIAFINATLQTFINEETGIIMHHVVKSGNNESTRALLPSNLKVSHLKMRCTTMEEYNSLRTAINNGSAHCKGIS